MTYVRNSIVFVMQRYGLWDHEGPLEEPSPSPEDFKVEGKTREGEEPGRGENDYQQVEREEDRVSASSTVETLEVPELNQLEKV